MKKLLFGLLFFFLYQSTFAQTVIEMEEYGGVYRIPCKVNGAKMKLIFDTGAESVCLSLSMADYLYDNDFITDDDIIGYGSTAVADGSIVDHIKIILKDIEIQDIHLRNVEAVVIDGQNAPLLLGQSAIKKLGKYSISGNQLILGSNNSKDSPNLTEQELNDIGEKADKAYAEGFYEAALEYYRVLYNQNFLTAYGILQYAECFYFTDKIEEALELCLSIQSEIELDNKAYLYNIIGLCNKKLFHYDEAMKFYEKAILEAPQYSYNQCVFVSNKFLLMMKIDKWINAKKFLDEYIKRYLNHKKIKITDCWDKQLKDGNLGYILIDEVIYYEDYIQQEQDARAYRILSAAWGCTTSIDYCESNNLNYSKKPNYNY